MKNIQIILVVLLLALIRPGTALASADVPEIYGQVTNVQAGILTIIGELDAITNHNTISQSVALSNIVSQIDLLVATNDTAEEILKPLIEKKGNLIRIGRGRLNNIEISSDDRNTYEQVIRNLQFELNPLVKADITLQNIRRKVVSTKDNIISLATAVAFAEEALSDLPTAKNKLNVSFNEKVDEQQRALLDALSEFVN